MTTVRRAGSGSPPVRPAGITRLRRCGAAGLTVFLLAGMVACSSDDRQDRGAGPASTPTARTEAQTTTLTGGRLVSVFGARDGADAAVPGIARVDGWGFAPGASAAFATMTAEGRVVIGTFPQTDNQVRASMATMSVGVFDPWTGNGPTFRSLSIPTSGGHDSATTPGQAVGGADVSDQCAVETAAGPRLLAVSSVPYKGWDADTGAFPAVVALRERAGDDASTVEVDSDRTRTADQLRGTDAGREAVVPGASAAQANAQGLTECDTVPNGDVLVSQYLPPGGAAGGVVALSPDGEIVAHGGLDPVHLSGPVVARRRDGTTVTVPTGALVIASPREVRSDPHMTDPADQRVVIVYDMATEDPADPDQAPRLQLPTALQELHYDAVAHRITPSSALLTLADSGLGAGASDLMQAATTAFAPDGTLFVAQTHARSVLSAPVAVFAPGSLGTRPTRAASIGHVVTPDLQLDAFDATVLTTGLARPDLGLAFSIDYDPRQRQLITVSAGGALLRAVTWGDRSWAAGVPAPIPSGEVCQVDLGGRAIADAHPTVSFQARQGAIDPVHNALFVPYQGHLADPNGPPLQTLPQYLFAIDLARLAARCS